MRGLMQVIIADKTSENDAQFRRVDTQTTANIFYTVCTLESQMVSRFLTPTLVRLDITKLRSVPMRASTLASCCITAPSPQLYTTYESFPTSLSANTAHVSQMLQPKDRPHLCEPPTLVDRMCLLLTCKSQISRTVEHQSTHQNSPRVDPKQQRRQFACGKYLTLLAA